MKCANPACGAQALYLRSGGIYSVDFLGADGCGWMPDYSAEGHLAVRRLHLVVCRRDLEAAWTTSAAFQESSHRIASRPTPHFPGGELELNGHLS
jgi:hypothetical protein